MKRAAPLLSHLLSIALLFQAIILPALFSQGCNSAPPPPTARVVTFDIDEDALDGLSQREQRDQLRDWLLLTALSDAGLNVDKFTKASFDLPAVRHGFLRPVANYEYGETRSRVIADGKVLALIPATKTPAERHEHLTRIADEQRKNTGEVPATLLVATYEQPDLKTLTAKLSPFSTVNGREFFTNTDYAQATIKSAAELEQFLKRIDDLTYAELKDGQLALGGRKQANYPARRLRVEDVAAVWQSERTIHDKLAALDAPRQTRLAEFNERWKQKIAAFNAQWGTLSYSSPSELEAKRRQSEQVLAQLNKQREQESAQLNQQLAREEQKAQRKVKQEKIVSGSGFSLDPHYDYQALKGLLPQVSSALLASPVLPRQQVNADLQKARSGLANSDANSFFELIDRYAQFLPAFGEGKSLHRVIEERGYSYQSARYDGELRGTEVGMVLFYTDLLAKLWAINYLNSTPTAAVADFRPMTNVPVARIFKRQIDELPGTRVWFGHSDKGFQSTNDGTRLCFGRNATRVFAASHPGVEGGLANEVPPAADAAGFIGWWNDHYEEVAQYEPEYLRLNQIIKWSLLIGWLNQANKGESLGFLNGDAVKVEHNAWLPDWVQKPEQQNLKFKQWERAGFYPKGYRNSDTEVVRLLSSEPFERFCDRRVLSGGVSLPGRATFEKRAPLPSQPKIEKPLLRPDIEQQSVSGGAQPRFDLRDGTSYNINSSSPNNGTVTAKPPSNARLQSPHSQRGLGADYQQTVTANPGGGYSVDARLGGAEIGSFSTAKTGRGFNTVWYARDMQKAEMLARRLSQTPESDRVLALDPDVAEAFELPNQQYLVRLRGSGNWLRIGSQTTPSADVPAGSEVKAADLQSGRREILLGRLDNAQVNSELARGKYVKLQPLNNGEPGRTIQLTSSEPGPNAKPAEIEVNLGNSKKMLLGHVDPTTGAIHIPTSSIQNDATVLSQLRIGDLRQIREKASTSSGTVHYQQTQRPLTTDDLAPAQKLAAELKYDEAAGQLDKLAASRGRSPELELLKNSILIRQGRVQDAVNNLAKLKNEAPRDLNAFYDQLYALHRHSPSQATRENLHRYGDYVYWQSHGNRGEVIPIFDNGKFGYELRGVALPPGERVTQIGSDARNRAAFYVQDAPGLSRFDWNAGFNKSLDQAISGEAGGVFKLSQSEISNAAPHRIFDKQGRSYTLVKAPAPPGRPPSPTPTDDVAGGPTKLRIRPHLRPGPTTDVATGPGTEPTPTPGGKRSGSSNDKSDGGSGDKDCQEPERQDVYIVRER